MEKRAASAKRRLSVWPWHRRSLPLLHRPTLATFDSIVQSLGLRNPPKPVSDARQKPCWTVSHVKPRRRGRRASRPPADTGSGSIIIKVRISPAFFPFPPFLRLGTGTHRIDPDRVLPGCFPLSVLLALAAMPASGPADPPPSLAKRCLRLASVLASPLEPQAPAVIFAPRFIRTLSTPSDGTLASLQHHHHLSQIAGQGPSRESSSSLARQPVGCSLPLFVRFAAPGSPITAHLAQVSPAPLLLHRLARTPSSCRYVL